MYILALILVALTFGTLGYFLNKFIEKRKWKKAEEEFFEEYHSSQNQYTNFNYTITPMQNPYFTIDDDLENNYDISNFYQIRHQTGIPSMSHKFDGLDYLKGLLKIAIENEDYEEAAKLRDKINEFKKE